MSRLIVLICALTAGAFAGFAEDIVDCAMYWQIDFTELWTGDGTKNWGDSALADPAVMAQLIVSYDDVTKGTVDYFFKEDGVNSFKKISQGDPYYKDVINWSDIDGASFYVELYGVEGNYLARSEEVTFSDLLNTYHAVDVDFSPNHQVINHSSMWVAVNYTPEPNSALLVLLGLAGLSLRRRRV